MSDCVRRLTVRFSSRVAGTYDLSIASPTIGERQAKLALPFGWAAWQAVMTALEPGFALDEAEPSLQAALRSMGDTAKLSELAGKALAEALLSDGGVRAGFDMALGLAEACRLPLQVDMRFGGGCDDLASLPWELLFYRDRFLIADTTIALSRCLDGATPPTEVFGELPVRVLLVLTEPAGASPILPDRAREELLHGLQGLDEVGAVVVDVLRPPTFDTLVEATSNGGYHMLVFYGHGAYDSHAGGLLVFEDQFGGPALVRASELGAALRNTSVRLVLLGACQSAAVGPKGSGDVIPNGRQAVSGRADIGSGVAPAVVRSGVPLAVGMQVSMRVDAALAFIRQFVLSLSAGKAVTDALADARRPIIRECYGKMWFAPVLYGQTDSGNRLFDPAGSLPETTAGLRSQLRSQRIELAALERQATSLGMLGQPGEIAKLRLARKRASEIRAALARHSPGGYAAINSPLYGVPSNSMFVGRVRELRLVAERLAGDQPVAIWGAGGIGKTALALEVVRRQAWRFPGGVLWLDCRGGPAFDALLDQIGGFCGVEAIEKANPSDKEMTVRRALVGLEQRCLLVVDNAEDVWNEQAVRRFLEALPDNCQVLTTTRDDPERASWPTIELVHPG